MEHDKMTEYIKVNLPLTEQDALAGCGEGVWVLVDPKTKEEHDANMVGKGYSGILANDSIYYPGLNYGALIQFELRGKSRPVADITDLQTRFPHLTPEAKNAVIRKIEEHHMDRRVKSDTVP